MLRNFRKPLVVIAPKILLRLSAASSNLNDMGPGTYFEPVLPDTNKSIQTKNVKNLVFVSGKHFYALQKHIEEAGINDTALIRIEQLCPFPTKELQDEVSRYPHAKSKYRRRNLDMHIAFQQFFREKIEVRGRQLNQNS